MNILFFGNSQYSVIIERALHERFGLSAVITVPNRTNPRGRVFISPVKEFAVASGVPVMEAARLTKEVIEELKSYSPDFLVVADYGLILPKSLLSVPKYASLNVHHSLLPKYRGPAPAPAAIINGDSESGVTIIAMNDKVDAGDILAQTRYTLAPDETTDSLLKKLNTLGAEALIRVMEQYQNGTVTELRQDESKATFTKRMSRSDGLVNLSEDAEANWRKIRAYGDWPGTYFIANQNGKEIKVKIKEARFEDGELVILRVIPENRKEMPYEDFKRGLRA